MKILKKIYGDLAERKSTRLFNKKNIPDKIIKEILMAGHLAPSAKNAQQWYFVVIKDKKLIHKIMTAKLAVRPEGSNMIENKTGYSIMDANLPNVLILVFLEKRRSIFFNPNFYGNLDKTDYVGVGGYSYGDVISLGCAIENMCLMAHRKGVGSCITGDILEEGIGQYVPELVGLDKSKFTLVSAIRFGYPLRKIEKVVTGRDSLEKHVKVIGKFNNNLLKEDAEKQKPKKGYFESKAVS